MLKLQWSDLFIRWNGRIGRVDFVTAVFKLGVFFYIGLMLAQIALLGPMLDLNASMIQGTQPDGSIGDPRRAFLIGLAALQTGLSFPLAALVYKRLQDCKAATQKRFAVWWFVLPALLAGQAIAAWMLALGFGAHVDPEFVRTVRLLTLVILVTCALLSPEPTENAFGASPVPSGPKSAGEYFRPAEQAPARRQTLAAPIAIPAASQNADVIQRSRRLPEQGRVKAGWFS